MRKEAFGKIQIFWVQLKVTLSGKKESILIFVHRTLFAYVFLWAYVMYTHVFFERE